jgi:thioredoxin-dependent peroxiredoxin
MNEIEALGATVCGISVDGEEVLKRFANKYKLPFALLSDRGGVVAGRYGSLLNLGLLKIAKRNTFLIDAEGRVAKCYIGVQPARNAAEVIADLRELRPRTGTGTRD